MRADKTLLQMKYARIIALIAKRAGIDSEKAMDMFYNSKTYMFMSQGISDFHCLSDNYLAEEVLREQVDVQENVQENVQEKTREEVILELLQKNNAISIRELAEQLDVTTKTIQRDLDKLKSQNIIRRSGQDKGGYWEVVEK